MDSTVTPVAPTKDQKGNCVDQLHLDLNPSLDFLLGMAPVTILARLKSLYTKHQGWSSFLHPTAQSGPLTSTRRALAVGADGRSSLCMYMTHAPFLPLCAL